MQSCDRRDNLIVYPMHQYYKPSALLCIFSLAVANMVTPVSWVACRKTARRAISGHADRDQPHGMAACSGANEFHAPRTSWRDPGGHGLGGHPPP